MIETSDFFNICINNNKSYIVLIKNMIVTLELYLMSFYFWLNLALPLRYRHINPKTKRHKVHNRSQYKRKNKKNKYRWIITLN